ncbi:MAG: hypothetical protein WCK17_08885 [Verrucomicrobiota bacterium]
MLCVRIAEDATSAITEVRPVRLPAEKREARELFRTARSAGGTLREIAILVNPGDAVLLIGASAGTKVRT